METGQESSPGLNIRFGVKRELRGSDLYQFAFKIGRGCALTKRSGAGLSMSGDDSMISAGPEAK
ncbi:hypothetical protein SBDP1_200077 [Syntrophobacter sp. SbD1]|nr:hypothetical protein SBDP1_200077 [Syntrophobacter sp. SbD1]